MREGSRAFAQLKCLFNTIPGTRCPYSVCCNKSSVGCVCSITQKKTSLKLVSTGCCHPFIVRYGFVGSGDLATLSNQARPQLLELLHSPATKQTHRAPELIIEDVHCFRNTRLAPRCQAIEKCLAASDSVRAERDGLRNVRSAHNAPVQDDFDIVPNRIANLWQNINSWWRSLKLPSSMV